MDQLIEKKKLGNPLIKGVEIFEPEKDAKKLNEAFKGLGCYELEVVEILCKRSLNQRLKIQEEYNKNHKTKLFDRIKSELYDTMEKFIKCTVMTPPQYYAYWVKNSIKGLGTDESGLNTSLISLTNEEMQQTKLTYKEIYKKDMIKEIKDDVSGKYEKILLKLCEGKRDETDNINMEVVQQDCKSLYEACNGIIHNGHEVFTQIFCERSYPHIKTIISSFPEINEGKNMEEFIKSSFNGDYKDILIDIHNYAIDHLEYFARIMDSAIFKKNVIPILRIAITRCDIDLLDIIKKFESITMYNTVRVMLHAFSGNIGKALSVWFEPND